jgi:hypothetical protein
LSTNALRNPGEKNGCGRSEKLDIWARFYQPQAALAAAKRLLAGAGAVQGKMAASRTNRDYGLGWWPEEFQALYEHEQQKFPLGGIPLIALISGEKAKPVGEQKSKANSDEERIFEEKAAQHIAQSLLSSNGLYVKLESGHEIHLYRPAWVIEAIRQVVDSVRKQASPPP